MTCRRTQTMGGHCMDWQRLSLRKAAIQRAVKSSVTFLQDPGCMQTSPSPVVANNLAALDDSYIYLDEIIVDRFIEIWV